MTRFSDRKGAKSAPFCFRFGCRRISVCTGMADKTYLVRFTSANMGMKRVVAASAEIHGEDLVVRAIQRAS
jgi:hypothetical protein